MIGTPIVSVQNASVVYDDVLALRNASIDIQKGEFLSLLGPSGSGKSTLLNAIAGVAPLSTGKIFIAGEDMTAVPSNRRGLGMVFQNYALMPHLTVFENVAFPLRIRHTNRSEIRTKVMEALDLVQLSEFAERRPKQLSGGQQQRVALARSFVYEPKVILMDEPLGALDKQLREEMQYEIRRLHGILGTTMIYVTHDQEEALSMSTNVALVCDGIIRDVGPPNDIYFRPRSEFTASFVGSSNLLEGCFRGMEGEHAIVELACGAIVRGISFDQIPAGGNVKVMLRPEILNIAESKNGLENMLEGKVVDVSLQGATCRAVIELGQGRRIQVQSLSRSASPLLLQNRVRLTWRPEDMIVLTR